MVDNSGERKMPPKKRKPLTEAQKERMRENSRIWRLNRIRNDPDFLENERRRSARNRELKRQEEQDPQHSVKRITTIYVRPRKSKRSYSRCKPPPRDYSSSDDDDQPPGMSLSTSMHPDRPCIQPVLNPPPAGTLGGRYNLRPRRKASCARGEGLPDCITIPSDSGDELANGPNASNPVDCVIIPSDDDSDTEAKVPILVNYQGNDNVIIIAPEGAPDYQATACHPTPVPEEEPTPVPKEEPVPTLVPKEEPGLKPIEQAQNKSGVNGQRQSQLLVSDRVQSQLKELIDVLTSLKHSPEGGTENAPEHRSPGLKANRGQRTCRIWWKRLEGGTWVRINP